MCFAPAALTRTKIHFAIVVVVELNNHKNINSGYRYIIQPLFNVCNTPCCCCWLFVLFYVAKDCGALLTPVNGSLTGNETTYPNSISFSCHLGFELIGSVLRTCEATGRWNGKQPHCKGNLKM